MKLRSISFKEGIKLKKSSVFMFLVVLIFFPPNIFDRISTFFDDLQRYLQLLLIGVLLIDLISKRKIKFTQSHIRWGIYCLYGLFLTLIFEPRAAYTFLMRVGVPVFLSVLLCMFCKNKPGGMQQLMKCIYYYMTALVVLNCVMMVLFPSGIIRSSGGATTERANWLFGSKNNVVLPLVFASTFFVNDYLQASKRNPGKFIIFFGMVFFNLMWAGSNGLEAFGGSSTGLLALLLFLMMYLIGYTPIKKHLMRVSVGWFAFAFLLLSVVVILGSISENALIGSLYGAVGKDATASSRTSIWMASISKVVQSPIIGHGYSNARLIGSIGQTYNLFLDCVYRYGVIGLIILISAFASYKIRYDTEFSKRIQPRYAFLVGIVSMLLCSLVNTISLEYIIMLMELYAYKQVTKEKERKEIRV